MMKVVGFGIDFTGRISEIYWWIGCRSWWSDKNEGWILGLGAEQLGGWRCHLRRLGILGENQDWVVMGLEISCPPMVMSVLRCPLNIKVKICHWLYECGNKERNQYWSYWLSVHSSHLGGWFLEVGPRAKWFITVYYYMVSSLRDVVETVSANERLRSERSDR